MSPGLTWGEVCCAGETLRLADNVFFQASASLSSQLAVLEMMPPSENSKSWGWKLMDKHPHVLTPRGTALCPTHLSGCPELHWAPDTHGGSQLMTGPFMAFLPSLSPPPKPSLYSCPIFSNKCLLFKSSKFSFGENPDKGTSF